MIKEIKDLPRTNGASRGSPPRQLILECDNCHSIFDRLYTTEIFKKQRHFCSMDCVYAGRNASPLHGRKTTRPCSQCKNDVTRMISLMEDKEHIFCNRDCYALWKSINTSPDRAAPMSSSEARAKAKLSLITLRSASGYVHSWQDRKHSDETKEKLRLSHTISGRSKGIKNGMFKRPHTEVSKAKMSDGHSKNFIEGRGHNYGGTRHVRGWHTSIKGNDGQPMFYRSSWELAMMLWLDTNQITTRYEYERLQIPYYSTENNKRHYVPDFLITYSDNSRVLVEIKPKQFLDNEKTRLKAEAAIAYCEMNDIQKYEILTGELLRERGVI